MNRLLAQATTLNKKNKGSALIITIFVVALLTILVAGLLVLSTSSYKATNKIDQVNRTRQVAESGMEQGVAYIKNSWGDLSKISNTDSGTITVDKYLLNKKISFAEGKDKTKTYCNVYMGYDDSSNIYIVSSAKNNNIVKSITTKINKSVTFGSNSSYDYKDKIFDNTNNNSLTIIGDINAGNRNVYCEGNTNLSLNGRVWLQGGLIDLYPNRFNKLPSNVTVNCDSVRIGQTEGLLGSISSWFASTNIEYKCNKDSYVNLDNTNALTTWGLIESGSKYTYNENIPVYKLLDLKNGNIKVGSDNIDLNKPYLIFKDSAGKNKIVNKDDSNLKNYFNPEDYVYQSVAMCRTTGKEVDDEGGFYNYYNKYINNTDKYGNNIYGSVSIEDAIDKNVYPETLLGLKHKLRNFIYEKSTYKLFLVDGDLNIDSGNYTNCIIYCTGTVHINRGVKLKTSEPLLNGLPGFLKDIADKAYERIYDDSYIGNEIVDGRKIDPLIDNFSNFGGSSICAQGLIMDDNSNLTVDNPNYLPDAFKDMVDGNLSSSNIVIKLTQDGWYEN